MGIFGLGRYTAPTEKINNHEAEPLDAAEVDNETAAIDDLLARAAMKNLVVEAGTTFEAKVPDGLSVKAIDLMGAFAMRGNGDRPVPLAVEADTAFFQATTTAAIMPRYSDD